MPTLRLPSTSAVSPVSQPSGSKAISRPPPSVSTSRSAPVGSDILAGEKAAGTLYTQAEGHGIAYLRFDRAKGDMTAEGATVRYTP